MNNEIIYEHYEKLYFTLKNIIIVSQERVLREDPDEIFLLNINFFIKSYLISICTYLESYLQDVAFKYAEHLDSMTKTIDIPHNFVHWRIGKDLKVSELKFENIDLSVNRDDISNILSANPYKTIKLFQNLGLDIKSKSGFYNNKSLINSVVTKRNSIVHHNDKAMDISFTDLLSYIDIFLIYMKSIDDSINEATGVAPKAP